MLCVDVVALVPVVYKCCHRFGCVCCPQLLLLLGFNYNHNDVLTVARVIISPDQHDFSPTARVDSNGNHRTCKSAWTGWFAKASTVSSTHGKRAAYAEGFTVSSGNDNIVISAKYGYANSVQM